MADFGPSDIKRALQEFPTLWRMLELYEGSLQRDLESIVTLKTVFSLENKGGKIHIVFNGLNFKVTGSSRVVLSGSTPFMLLSFDYEEKDELNPLLKIFIASNGSASVGSFDSTDIITLEDVHMSAGAKIFDKLAKAAYYGGHISA
ncbi:hypothetical protein [Serratia sp. M24T3]|uniref:hypothetical protein n=1 Tax=Serratia sp. M24T3 TaxID=932213 RepID=UPI00025BBCEA|nr:hypothetical protein [Serratia sp. M24T3]EIC82066.1 hypothetical protein SPM24T3_23832 [Serratia sp. M24T3]